MIAVFDSPVFGHCGTSSNLISLAAWLCMEAKQKILVIDGKFEKNGLDELVIKKKWRESEGFYDDYGIDALLRLLKQTPINEEVLFNTSFSLLDGKFNLLSATRQMNLEVFEHSLQSSLGKILEKSKETFDFVLVDIGGYTGNLKELFYTAADCYIVNLSQTPKIMDYLLEFKYSDKEKKIFYLFGNYDEKSRYNIKNLSFMVSCLQKKNTAYIAHNTSFLDAVWENKLFEYIWRIRNSEPGQKNYHYLQSVKQAAGIIFGKVGK